MSLHALQHRLRQIGPAAIAVSGGIDSLTLACVAADLIPDSVIFHAVSPAVPEAATARVRTFAQDRGWHLNVIDAGEFSDMHYRANPVNRCFYCKTNLYGSIAAKTKSPPTRPSPISSPPDEEHAANHREQQIRTQRSRRIRGASHLR